MSRTLLLFACILALCLRISAASDAELESNSSKINCGSFLSVLAQHLLGCHLSPPPISFLILHSRTHLVFLPEPRRQDSCRWKLLGPFPRVRWFSQGVRILNSSELDSLLLLLVLEHVITLRFQVDIIASLPRLSAVALEILGGRDRHQVGQERPRVRL
jgi:hypothetical protein